MVKRIKLILLLGLMVSGWTAAAEYLEYHEKTGEKTTVHAFIIEKDSGGYRIQLTSTFPDKIYNQVFYVDRSLKSTAWEFEDRQKNTKVSARLADDEVRFEGIHRGRKFSRGLKVRGDFWNQTFNLGLRDFVINGRKKMKFCAIGVSGPGEMKMGKFTVTREGTEKTMVNGEHVDSVRIKITLSGMLSMFWHGDYWYRKTDGRFLKYRGKNAPRQPVSESQLVQETDHQLKNDDSIK